MVHNDQNPTPFTELNEVLAALTKAVQDCLGDDFVGVYLTGSFALGGADNDSDVDVMMVCENPLSDEKVADLTTMHQRIYDMDSEWAKHIEGSYFPRALAKTKDNPQSEVWYLDNGSRILEPSTHDNEWVVRWVTREYGITLAGEPIKSIIDPVDVSLMKREVAKTAQDWGDDILTGKYEIKSQWAQPFAVLMYCRMLHTLATGHVYSKFASAEWAKKHLDNQWSGLIADAWAKRPNPNEKAWLPTTDEAIAATKDFIQYALEKKNDYLA